MKRGWPTWWSLRLRKAGKKQPKRPVESKSGRDFPTGSSPTDSKGIDLSYSYLSLGGVGSTTESRVQDDGKSQHAERGASNVRSARSSSSLARKFIRYNWVRVSSA